MKKDLPLRQVYFFERSLFALPFPVGDFWKIETILVDVLLMLNEFVAHLLVEVCAAVAEV